MNHITIVGHVVIDGVRFEQYIDSRYPYRIGMRPVNTNHNG